MKTSEEITVGKIPAGATIIRKAGPKDFLADPSRVVLYRDKDGYHYWLCWGDRTVPANSDGT